MRNTNHNQNPYTAQVLAKGRDLPKAKPITEVPENLRDRFSTVEEYQEALHDFLNGY
jgi:hypothetical protein